MRRLPVNISVLYVSFVLFVACQSSREHFTEYHNKSNNRNLEKLEILENAFHFYVIGDWGRNGYFLQKNVASIMHQAAFLIEPEFIISTGDNFYPNGIASKSDPYIKSSFEDVYSGYNLFCPWYVVLGNHGYRGNPQAQVEYTKVSQRWNMPERYFKLDKKYGKGDASIRFLFLDTNPFEDFYYLDEKYQKNIQSQDSLAQKKWIEKNLKESTATWNIVIGHHPLYTSGKRKDRPNNVKKHLEYLFEKYRVNAYFAGHEHDLQYQKPQNVKTHHFVSGAGSQVRPTSYANYTKFAKSIQGFMIVSLTEKEMFVQIVDWKGRIIYKTSILNERTK